MIELPFARGEYAQRLKKIRADMQKRDLELLIVNDVANQHYITAYDGWSFYTPQVVLVPAEDEEPVWIGRAMDAAGGLLTAWMRPENVVGFPEDHVQRADRHPMDWIAQWITQKGWGRRRIGIELEAYYFSPKAHARLVAGLPLQQRQALALVYGGDLSVADAAIVMGCSAGTVKTHLHRGRAAVQRRLEVSG